MTRRLPQAAALLALVLTACGEDPAGSAQQGERAAGEVLGGTISDAMIPLEQVTSQSPPMARSATSGQDGERDGTAAADEAGAQEAAAPEAEAEAATAAPAPEPAPAE